MLDHQPTPIALMLLATVSVITACDSADIQLDDGPRIELVTHPTTGEPRRWVDEDPGCLKIGVAEDASRMVLDARDDAVRAWSDALHECEQVLCVRAWDQGGADVIIVQVEQSDRWDTLGFQIDAVATTVLNYDLKTARIVTARIFVNMANHPIEDGHPGSLDLASVLIHETGHSLGFNHSDRRNSVMWPNLGYGEHKRALDDRDVTDICTLADALVPTDS